MYAQSQLDYNKNGHGQAMVAVTHDLCQNCLENTCLHSTVTLSVLLCRMQN